MVRKGKFDDIPTGELFDAEPLRSGRVRTRSVKSVAHGNCPRCLADKIGLVRIGVHLVWRLHTYRTWSGAPMQCGASGVTVCDAPEASPPLNTEPVACPHDQGRRL